MWTVDSASAEDASTRSALELRRKCTEYRGPRQWNSGTSSNVEASSHSRAKGRRRLHKLGCESSRNILQEAAHGVHATGRGSRNLQGPAQAQTVALSSLEKATHRHRHRHPRPFRYRYNQILVTSDLSITDPIPPTGQFSKVCIDICIGS